MSRKRKDKKLSHWLRFELQKPAPIEFQDTAAMAEGEPQLLGGEIIARNVVKEAMRGERWAIELCYDRTEGKPIQAVKDDASERGVEERLEDVTKHHLNELARSLGVAVAAEPIGAGPVVTGGEAGELDEREADLATTAPEQYGDFWTCPATGIAIPKTLKDEP
jgi:hypothetical protein